MAEKMNEQFFADMVGICSKFFKEMHETCEKYRTKQPIKKKGKDASSENGEKRVRKPKDPNAPKKPTANVYMIYFNERRPNLLQERPELKSDPKGLARIAGQEWKSLPQDTKSLYYAKAAKIKEALEADAAAESAKSKIKNESEEKKTAAKPVAKPAAKSQTLKPIEPAEEASSQKMNSDISDNDESDDSMVSESSEADEKKETPRRKALESSDGESDVEEPKNSKKVKKN